ncbi:MAG: glucose-6-phosphate isomerase [Microthrixaceae bacterium]
MRTPNWLDPIDITATGAWDALMEAFGDVRDLHLRELLAQDGRREAMTVEVGDLYLDLTRHRTTPALLDALVAVAERAGVAERRDAMFAGEHINTTEDRAVGHVGLRTPDDGTFAVDGNDAVPGIHQVLDAMAELVERVHSGEWVGATGERIRTVINVGIGGSDLGPEMAYRALRRFRHADIECRFVSNIDPAGIAAATEGVDPESTLVVVVSKTFTTDETLTNARTLKEWVRRGVDGDTNGGIDGDDEARAIAEADDEAWVAKHFVAVSTNAEAVAEFGIDVDNMFRFWDWVGGRYSVWSAVGLSLMLAVGEDHFQELLAGAHEVDEHFRTEPLRQNAPVLMGLLRVLNRDLYGFPTHAVLPYAADLGRFPAYLQQLDMESNGKRVRLDGSPVTLRTGPIVWGQPGTNGQHAFYQLLHQGTSIVPADIIAFSESADDSGDHQVKLLANALAQGQALAEGRSAEEVEAAGVPEEEVAHRTFPGNRPSTTILAPELTPSVLGQLIALYEQCVFVQGVIWGINSFDQWGVELGKELAGDVLERLNSDEARDAPGGAARWVLEHPNG